MDFFYDGGHRVRPAQDEFQKYQDGMLNFLDTNDSLDFILLQEVDQHSKRSYYSNQAEAIESQLPAYSSVFSKNYDVSFVPMPLSHPMGKVSAGMMTLSGLTPETALRLALPQVYSWPMKHFMLDRAAIATHYPITTQKELVVINIHNSAYVDDSSALAKEIAVVKNYAQSQYQAGNFVVIGGDWNQNPPGFDTLRNSDHHQLDYQLEKNSLGKKWQWAWDKTKPTNRSLNKPLNQKVNKTIIDFYVVSPNLCVDEVRVLPLDFSFSDHEPVYLRVSIPPQRKNQQ
jgi:endonuclease/exonuclease/phosphatase family metal-dependent hydrolase